MFDRIRACGGPLVLALFVALCAGSGAFAQDAVWRVSKSSGDVSVTTSGGQPAALMAGATLNPGDNIRTGQSGRVLLTRGEETLLVSPNSMIGIPLEKRSGLQTTIIQQAGSILLEVEKREVQHFQVETPYLAAVVKGTQFRVTVNNSESRVEVLKGKVEVMALRSGQYAMVQPGQAAQVMAQGSAALSLSGSGTLNAILQGTPRAASVSPVPIAKENSSASEPTRIASVFGDVPPTVRTWSSESSSKDGSWSSSFASMGSGLFGTGGRKSRQEDFALAAGLACGVGIVVAFSVSALRRRKSKKPIKS